MCTRTFLFILFPSIRSVSRALPLRETTERVDEFKWRGIKNKYILLRHRVRRLMITNGFARNYWNEEYTIFLFSAPVA